jgi:hypothetical protein
MINPRTFRGLRCSSPPRSPPAVAPRARRRCATSGRPARVLALGAIGGGIGVAQIENGPDDGEIAAGAAAGLVAGALVGGLIGLAICKEEEPPPPAPPPTATPQGRDSSWVRSSTSTRPRCGQTAGPRYGRPPTASRDERTGGGHRPYPTPSAATRTI